MQAKHVAPHIRANTWYLGAYGKTLNASLRLKSTWP